MLWGYLRSGNALVIEQLIDMRSFHKFWSNTRRGWLYNAHQINMIHRGVLCQLSAVNKKTLERLSVLDRFLPPMWLFAFHYIEDNEDALTRTYIAADKFARLCNDYNMHACTIFEIGQCAPSQRMNQALLTLFDKLSIAVGAPKMLVHFYVPLSCLKAGYAMLGLAQNIISERPEAGFLPIANCGLYYASQLAAIVDDLQGRTGGLYFLLRKPWDILSLARSETGNSYSSAMKPARTGYTCGDLRPRLTSSNAIAEYLKSCDPKMFADLVAIGRVILAKKEQYLPDSDYDYATSSMECQGLL